MEIIRELVEAYAKTRSGEGSQLEQLRTLLGNGLASSWIDRGNMVGHVTASALIVDPKRGRVLQIYHKGQGRWLQPGGHIDPGDANPLEAAFREAKEEVGLDRSTLTLLSPSFDRYVPLDIDTHYIAASTTKGEQGHYHHDFRYVMLCHGDAPVIKTEGNVDYKWVPLAELTRDKTFERVAEKLRHALSYEFRTKQFYQRVIDGGAGAPAIEATADCRPRSVVVSHVIPDGLYYLQAVDRVSPIVTIVPKPSSINPATMKMWEGEGFKFAHVRREEMPTPGNALVQAVDSTNCDLILYDIGGYFADAQAAWPADLIGRVKLVVEDTENGEQKYERHVRDKTLRVPVVSVARSPLKDNEDFLVGQSILFSADALLRDAGTLIQYMRCSVLGYGKIGRSIAFHLLQRGVKPAVFDTNPVRRLAAFNHLCAIPDRDPLIAESDVIFAATGNRSLGLADFRGMKNGCFVFTVTSSDDELDAYTLKGEYQKTPVTEHLVKYHNDRNFFFLANNGNAVNFIHNAVMGSFIHLVRAEMLVAAMTAGEGAYPAGKVSYVSDERRKKIAQAWIDAFDPEERGLSSIEYIR